MCIYKSFTNLFLRSSILKLNIYYVEQCSPKGQVTGSNPVGVTIKRNNINILYFYSYTKSLNSQGDHLLWQRGIC